MTTQEPNYQDPNAQGGNPYQQYQQVPPPGYPQQYQQVPTEGHPQQYQQQPPPGMAPAPGMPPPGMAPGYGPPPGYQAAYLGAPMAPERPKRGRTLLFASLAGLITLVLIGGVGAWAAHRLWFSSGDQPESAMPASVGFYARLDMSPSVDQTVKLFNVLRKFPQIDTRGDSIPELEKAIFEDLDLEDLSYAADVEPWFDHKIGLGAWLDSNSQLYALIVMASTDDDKARAALKKAVDSRLDGEVGYVVSDGWALLAMGESDAPAAAKAAASEAERSSLADKSSFEDALDAMPDGQVAIAWGDLQQLRTYAAESEEFVDDVFVGMPTDELPADISGAMMMAAQASASGIELRMRISGLNQPVQLGDKVLPALGDMPSKTVVGVAASMPEEPSDAVDTAVSALTGVLADTRIDSSEVADVVEGLATAKLISVCLTGVSGGMPIMNVAAETRTASSASTIERMLDDVAGAVDARVVRNGNTVEVTTDGYSGGGPKLSGQSSYKTAMDGMPNSASIAAYIDITRMFEIGDVDSDTQSEIAPLKAIGVGIGQDGDDLTMLVRAVIG